MKNLIKNSIYSEGKYPNFVFLDSEFVRNNLFSLYGESEVLVPDLNFCVMLPSGDLDIYVFTGTPTNNLSTRIEMDTIEVPIKVGDVNLNDIYLESKDHSKYVKYTWQDLSEEGTEQFAQGGGAQQFYQRVGEKTDLSWIHYISYRDEDGVFQGNILEFIPIYLALSIANDYDGSGNVSNYTWYDLGNNLLFAKPKDNPIDFVWGNIDSTSPGENNPNLFTKLIYIV